MFWLKVSVMVPTESPALMGRPGVAEKVLGSVTALPFTVTLNQSGFQAAW
jgi:hypothetical protein